MRVVPFLCLFLLLSLLSASAHAFPARVVAVADGDTLTIEPVGGGARELVRLHGIDAPELRQPYGEMARAFVRTFALHKGVTVHLEQQGRDSHGHLIATVEVPGAGILQELLLGAGLAWVCPRYCQGCEKWEAMQETAKAQRLGLWADKNPVPPWEWRQAQRR